MKYEMRWASSSEEQAFNQLWVARLPRGYPGVLSTWPSHSVSLDLKLGESAFKSPQAQWGQLALVTNEQQLLTQKQTVPSTGPSQKAKGSFCSKWWIV